MWESAEALMRCEVKGAGTSQLVEIRRDREGIPHVRAGSAPDAFFG